MNWIINIFWGWLGNLRARQIRYLKSTRLKLMRNEGKRKLTRFIAQMNRDRSILTPSIKIRNANNSCGIAPKASIKQPGHLKRSPKCQWYQLINNVFFSFFCSKPLLQCFRELYMASIEIWGEINGNLKSVDQLLSIHQGHIDSTQTVDHICYACNRAT